MRSALFDNLKFALIILVVAGHVLLPIADTRLTNNLLYTIYSFHMPCFVMVTGYFSKGIYRNWRFRWDRLLNIIWLYLIFEVLVHITEGLLAGEITWRVDIWHESGAPWYLLAMIWWYLSIPVFSRLKPAYTLSLVLFMGLVAGYWGEINDFLALDRTLAFAPYFYLGYYAPNHMVSMLRRPKIRWMLALMAVMEAGIVLFFAYDKLWQFNLIVYGVTYQRLAEPLRNWGGLLRLIWYGFALILSLGFLSFIPNKRLFFTKFGERTLQVYILHRLIRDLAQYFGWYELINVQYRSHVVLLLAISVALAFVLSERHITRAFDWIQNVPRRVCGKVLGRM